MTRTLAGGIAAATFALGILTGMAGTIVARDADPGTDLTAVMAEHMAGQGTAGMMAGSMMGGSMMGPGASGMPGSQHDQHHATPTPEVPK